MLENLVDSQKLIPKDLSMENEDAYFKLFKSKDLGKLISNIGEYLLET